MTGATSGRLTGNGHRLAQRVYFEDTDFSGLVYHARYLHFLERGRSDFLRLLGVSHRELAKDGLVFAVRRMEIDWLAPARIDDVVEIDSTLDALTGARIVLGQAMTCDGRPLVAARVTIALLNAAGRPARLPGVVREAFASLKARAE